MPTVLTSNKKLTIIIPFLNEGEEVECTLNSIRKTAGDKVEILIINDASTDRINYQSVAHKYHATYLKNRTRIGVAAARDKGISLIATPYFLLLDAHMRFYQHDWAEQIIEELDKNDRVLLCCNTKVLSKDNAGRIKNNNKTAAFGATINLDGNKYMLNAEWSCQEKDQNAPIEDIACVLGAGYAASKRYWQYLRGLDGLIHYGSDEAYISLKVWLEGGQCRLLKNIRIGHIYRTQAPYQIENRDSVFNKLWIAETLLPFSYRLRTFGALYQEYPQHFEEAYRLLRKKKKKTEELKQYYRQIFTVDFNIIIEQNKKKTPQKKVQSEESDQLFKRLLLNCNTLDSDGLWHGRIGCLLFLVKYDHIQNNDLYEELIEELIDEVFSHVENGNLSIDLGEGLCGIAYGLAWLIHHHLKEGDLADILEEVDQRIMERDPLRISDPSLQTGLAGILFYALYRLQIAQEQHLPPPFDTAYLDHLHKAALKAVKNPGMMACFEMASWLITYMQDQSLKLEIPDITQILNLTTRMEPAINSFTLGLKNGLAGLGLSKLTE